MPQATQGAFLHAILRFNGLTLFFDMAFITAVPVLSGNHFAQGHVLSKCRSSRAPLVLPSRTRSRIAFPSWQMKSAESEFSKDLRPAVKDLMTRMKKCSVYLVGPMGSGKSALGKFLSHQFEFRFLDTDELIELSAKKDIPTIFANDGEEAFRDLETAILDQVQAFIGCCVATGGGVVMRTQNWAKLQTGLVVFLDVPADVLYDRLKGDTSRPLLQGGELRTKIETILKERRSMYEQADVTVEVAADDAVDDIAEEVIRKLNNFIKENPPRLSKLYAANLKAQGG